MKEENRKHIKNLGPFQLIPDDPRAQECPSFGPQNWIGHDDATGN